MARGKLRIYLGAAPGVGKTYAMLDEGWRGKARGKDVCVGLVVTHGRPKTEAQIRDLEVIPPKMTEYRGGTFPELDTDAVIARQPQVALVDELAHTNIPGSRHEKRWQDVEEILEAGIDVISTVNIQHLESLNDVVNQITGVVQRETVPDAIVRSADQIELVDMSPEALRRRMAHGNIYAPEKVDAALGNYFRVGNLAALRELALLWVADRVEASLQSYMADHGIAGTWETRERIVVALTGAPGGDQLIRRAARMATRAKGDLLGVHVRPDDGLTREPSDLLQRHRELLAEMGGTFHEVAGNDIPAALVAFAKAERATQLVMGNSRRSRWTELTKGSVINRVIRLASPLDVHVIGTEMEEAAPKRGGLPRVHFVSAHERRGVLLAIPAAIVALGAMTAVLAANRSSVSPPEGLLVYLAAVVGVAVIGGAIPGLLTTVVAVLLDDWFLVKPYGSFAVGRGGDLGYLAAFLATALGTLTVVQAAGRRRADAKRARFEADSLMTLAHRLTATLPNQAVVEQIHDVFNRTTVTLLDRRGDEWLAVASAGGRPASAPDDGERVDLAGGTRVLVLEGPPLPADDREVLSAFVAHLDAIMRMQSLQGQADAASQLAQANDLRTALLAAVSHDLRTPLAAIKASATSLLEEDVVWSADQTREFLRTIDGEVDRLNGLVGNLLDMSRLQTGGLRLNMRPVGLDEVVPGAMASLSRVTSRVIVDVPETLPAVEADPALLERAVANLIDNAVGHSGDEGVVRVEAGQVQDRVHLRVVDRGRGIKESEKPIVFRPFQRLGDTDSSTGVGLGLAVAKGFIEAMGGELTLEDTPGGGATMIISLPVAATSTAQGGADARAGAGAGDHPAGAPGGAADRPEAGGSEANRLDAGVSEAGGSEADRPVAGRSPAGGP